MPISLAYEPAMDTKGVDLRSGFSAEQRWTMWPYVCAFAEVCDIGNLKFILIGSSLLIVPLVRCRDALRHDAGHAAAVGCWRGVEAISLNG